MTKNAYAWAKCRFEVKDNRYSSRLYILSLTEQVLVTTCSWVGTVVKKARSLRKAQHKRPGGKMARTCKIFKDEQDKRLYQCDRLLNED